MTTPERSIEEIIEDLLKHAVNRFCGWSLPKDFHPDGGISFEKEYNVSYNAHQGLPPSQHEPIGTNLFTADQAKEMLRFLFEDEVGNDFLTQALQAERQKREEVRQETMREVMSKLRRQFNSADDELSLEEIEVALYELDEEALTQPNNPK